MHLRVNADRRKKKRKTTERKKAYQWRNFADQSRASAKSETRTGVVMGCDNILASTVYRTPHRQWQAKTELGWSDDLLGTHTHSKKTLSKYHSNATFYVVSPVTEPRPPLQETSLYSSKLLNDRLKILFRDQTWVVCPAYDTRLICLFWFSYIHCY